MVINKEATYDDTSTNATGTGAKGAAVVTGGNAGIGLAIARELAANGWPVAMLARNAEEPLRLTGEGSGSA